jgi:hypothetical protein
MISFVKVLREDAVKVEQQIYADSTVSSSPLFLRVKGVVLGSEATPRYGESRSSYGKGSHIWRIETIIFSTLLSRKTTRNNLSRQE